MQVASSVDARRPVRQDTFDLREQIHQEVHVDPDTSGSTVIVYAEEELEHSVLEEESVEDEQEEYMDEDDDASSDLSIPNESIDFDLVYSLHSFAATVEGQANVVRGDSLFLMDDSNSYWWLVRVLKTQEVGYIPAENIETPFERLARLNKHRNVDLASATQAELNESLNASQDRLRANAGSRAGKSPSPRSKSQGSKNVQFTPALYVHRYPPAIWKEDEIEDPDIEWDDEGYEDEDHSLADDQATTGGVGMNMEPDDGISWDDTAVQNMQARQLQQAQLGGISLSLQPVSQQAYQQQQQQQQRQLLKSKQEQATQQQRELVAQQLAQQQLQQQQRPEPSQQQQQPPLQIPQIDIQPLRPSNPRERVNSQDSASRTIIDPLQVTETRKLTVTPTIIREEDPSIDASVSSIVERQRQQQQKLQEEESAKRLRDEEAAEEARKKAKSRSNERVASPVSSVLYHSSNSANSSQSTPKSDSKGGKLRKDSADEEGSGKKKKSSMFGSLFGRKKDKKEKTSSQITSTGTVDSSELAVSGRASEDSSVNTRTSTGTDGSVTGNGLVSPTTATAMQQQQQQSLRLAGDAKYGGVEPHTPERAAAQQLRQRDQQQQALYQKYLNNSPSSPPEPPSYGLQSAPVVMGGAPASAVASGSNMLGLPGATGAKPRPGSLILTQSIIEGIGGPTSVPELSVVRVFAGKHLQTDATFKTVLLNSSTTSAELIKQATQRFRLSLGPEELEEYYLTIKQVEGGGSAILRPDEKPLMVFEHLVMETETLPRVKRSSVGSISSISSNLSLHPAIRKLSMNDFTDDSAVKFYLNRKTDNITDDSVVGHDGTEDDTLIAHDVDESSSGLFPLPYSPTRGQYLGVNVASERFTSPTLRFAMQVLIYPDDLPDDMAFHPYTEAIVFKDTLKGTEATAAPTVSPTMRKKVFVFPKNVTVAEVIEIALERFGISEGVVDGGDEIEDKGTKRRSVLRVRYGLYVHTTSTLSNERELAPSSKVIDAYPKPPNLRAPERPSLNNKRRSADSTLLLGSMDDVNPEDPVFILRRAISYRNSTSRHRMSAPLDEIALQKLHRDSYSSASSSDPNVSHDSVSGQKQQPSRQEILRQREATRANQRAILSAVSNSVRGMDVLLPGNAMLRSSRYDSTDRMRYSYVEPDGETYDISDIVEEELRDQGSSRNDLLEGVLGKKDAVGERLNRVLSKIKIGKQKDVLASRSSLESPKRSSSISEYSTDSSTVIKSGTGTGRSTPTQARPHNNGSSRSGTTTPTGRPGAGQAGGGSRRNPSVASVLSDTSGISGYDTAISHAATSPTSTYRSWATPTPTSRAQPQEKKDRPRRVKIPNDDFGVSHMVAIIECKSTRPKTTPAPADPGGEFLFGKPIDMEQLHPSIREIYAPAFRKLEEVDKMLDDHLTQVLADR